MPITEAQRRQKEFYYWLSNKPIAVTLFSSGGGVECGMVECGIEPVAGAEFNPEKPKVSAAIADAHELNFPNCELHRQTVEELAATNYADFPRNPDILWASPMCSHFSDANNYQKEKPEDIESAKAVAIAIQELQPKHFFLENVRQYQGSESWQLIKDTLEEEGYQIESSLVIMSDYGIPQARKRFIVRAAINTTPLPLPAKQPEITWYEAIADLIPNLPDSKLLAGQKESLEKFLKNNKPTPLLIDRLGGRGEYRCVPSYKPAKTILRAHFTDGYNRNRNKFADIWLPDGTVKAVSIECIRRIQSFPDWYKLPKRIAIAGSILGYSVPPKFVKLLLKPLSPNNIAATPEPEQPPAQKKTDFWITVAASHDQPHLMPKGLSYLFPASSFWNRSRAKIKSFPRAPRFPIDAKVGADSGGYVATSKWGGKYPYSPAQYVKWLSTWNPEWAATMDYCCEPPITGNSRSKIQHRQKQTTKLAWHFWNTYKDYPWMWVPTIQGWDIEDYTNHAIALKPLLKQMQNYYGEKFRVGIGTLCARASTKQILEIVKAISKILPEFKFHLWGVKVNASQALRLNQVGSFDSAAWDGLAGARSRQTWQEQYKGKMTQREYCYGIALPKYLKSLEKKGINVILPDNRAIAIAKCT